MKSIRAYILLAALVIGLPALSQAQQAPEPMTDLYKALHAAATDRKLAFILLGRASCGNCNATKALITEGKIPVTDTDFVMADLNIDDARAEGEFMRKFGKEKFGCVLPFVVVTDSHGKVLAVSGGHRKVHQWRTLLEEAKNKAAEKALTTGTSASSSNWPFKPRPE